MASLNLRGVNKVYPSGETGLYDINLEADDKEFLVVVGADGSGKSSLLRVVAGLEDATSGSVFIDGKDMADVEPKNRDIAMVGTAKRRIFLRVTGLLYTVWSSIKNPPDCVSAQQDKPSSNRTVKRIFVKKS